MVLEVGRRQYNPEKMNYIPGELLEKGKDIGAVDESDTKFRLYRKNTKKAETEKDFLELGFDKHKTQPEGCFVFVNKFGDKVVLDSKGEKVFSSF